MARARVGTKVEVRYSVLDRRKGRSVTVYWRKGKIVEVRDFTVVVEYPVGDREEIETGRQRYRVAKDAV